MLIMILCITLLLSMPLWIQTVCLIPRFDTFWKGIIVWFNKLEHARDMTNINHKVVYFGLCYNKLSRPLIVSGEVGKNCLDLDFLCIS